MGAGKNSPKGEKNAERCEKTGIVTPILDKRILSEIAKGTFREIKVSDPSVMGVKGVGGVEMVDLRFR